MHGLKPSQTCSLPQQNVFPYWLGVLQHVLYLGTVQVSLFISVSEHLWKVIVRSVSAIIIRS